MHTTTARGMHSSVRQPQKHEQQQQQQHPHPQQSSTIPIALNPKVGSPPQLTASQYALYGSTPDWASAAVASTTTTTTTSLQSLLAKRNDSNDNLSDFDDDDGGGGDGDEELLLQQQQQQLQRQHLLQEHRLNADDENGNETDFSSPSSSSSAYGPVTLSHHHLFRQVLLEDDIRRKNGIERVTSYLLDLARSCTANNDNPDTAATMIAATSMAMAVDASSADNSAAKQLHTFAPIIVRFATDCPFDDVRAGFSKLYSQLKDMNLIHIPCTAAIISAFVHPSDVPPIVTPDKSLRHLFHEMFLYNGRVENTFQLMSWHPKFCECYYKCLTDLMRDEGSLPLPWRNYLAITAASRHHCDSIIRLQEAEFLYNGGNPDWLKGVDFIPQKLYNILQFNALLTHQPWLITKSHIEKLVKGDDSWSFGELVHAIVLLSTFNSFAGFVFGNGILPEPVDIEELEALNRQRDVWSKVHNQPQQQQQNHIKLYEENMRVVSKLKEESFSEDDEPTPQDKSQVFEKAATEDGGRLSTNLSSGSPIFSALLGNSSSNSSSSSSNGPSDSSQQQQQQQQHDHNPVWCKYVGSFDMRCVDFSVRSTEYGIFNVQDYNWKDNAYELLSRYYPSQADLADAEFDEVRSMTDRRFSGVENIDTTRFRNAIWYFVQRIYGMQHDDYNYEEVNKFLNKEIKHYIRKVVCTPEQITINDFLNMGFELRPQEKCHICLLAIEARKQAQIVYGLHSIDMYMKLR